MAARIQIYLQHLLYGCFFIALCAGAVTVSAMLEGTGTVEWQLPLAVMGATLIHYNFHYLFQRTSQQIETPRMQWSGANRNAQYGYVLVGILCLLPYTFQLHWKLIRLWIPVMLVGVTYSFPVMPFKIRRWKEQGLLKWLLLSLTWTLVTAWIPLTAQGVEGRGIWIPVLLRLELLLALCWLFDMRDRDLDRAHGVHTLPVVLGWKKAKNMAFGWVILYLLTSLIVYPITREGFLTGAHLMTGMALLAVTYAASEKRSDLFYLFWVDGLLLWHFLCMLGAHLATNGLN